MTSTETAICQECDGDGFPFGDSTYTCGACDGTGRTRPPVPAWAPPPLPPEVAAAIRAAAPTIALPPVLPGEPF